MTDKTTRAFGTLLLLLLLGVPLSLGACGGDSAGGAHRDEEAARTEEKGRADEHGRAGEEGAVAEGRVTLSEAAYRTAQIQTEAAQSGAVGTAGSGGLQVPGQVDFDPARVAVVSPRTAGRIERLTAVPGDRVGAGQTVALISSPAFLTAQSDLAQAARRAQLLAGTGDEAGARALVAAARRRLQLLGAGQGVIARLESGGEPSAVLGVPAPFGGSILETLAPAGSAVEAGTPIFRIADLTTLLVAADLPERAMGSVRVGTGARVSVAAAAGESFAGRVERLGDVVDPQTRTLKAYVRVPNRGRVLRPGMFATVAVDASVAGASVPATSSVTVPASAVVTDGETRYVFVEVGPRSYERRAVEVSAGAPEGRVAVLGGVAAGDRVVSRGAFTLKSELGKAAFGEHDD
jgi:RND family efflux transporter MFP subunit